MNNKLQQIKISSEHKVNGFYTLLTNGSVTCLPDNEYIVSEDVLPELLKKGIKFKILKNGSKIKNRISNSIKV